MRHTAIIILLLAGCGAGVTSSSMVTGRLDATSLPLPTRVTASTDDGLTTSTTPAADGTFSLSLDPGHVWSISLATGDGQTTAVALPRQGHFDRGVEVDGAVDEALGRVWAPSPQDPLRLLPEANPAGCVDGLLPSGEACAVTEAFTQCADGAPRPLADPTSLFLGTGELADLPGASRGTRYAIPARVPLPVFWACDLTPTPPP